MLGKALCQEYPALYPTQYRPSPEQHHSTMHLPEQHHCRAFLAGCVASQSLHLIGIRDVPLSLSIDSSPKGRAGISISRWNIKKEERLYSTPLSHMRR